MTSFMIPHVCDSKLTLHSLFLIIYLSKKDLCMLEPLSLSLSLVCVYMCVCFSKKKKGVIVTRYLRECIVCSITCPTFP